MIVFDLQCSNGHRFEGWFEDCRAYDNQKEKNLICCPVCNDDGVCKIPSTFGIRSAGSKRENQPSESDNPDKSLAELAMKVSHFVEKHFDNVGCEFAKEALKIHYGVTEPRNIRGISTPEEEKTLKEEGIDFVKIPAFPPGDPDV
jgi:hypothetical protein